ncbi:carbonate dehydratase [Algoriphagus halophytocola]|uniref:Carbonic anhydrase n=1 Tax=Algoriphagus halophytocola TaxID=2991499 RepID=A0ABY6MLW2_9BACT|nr:MULTISPECIES: carbonate dehydratase [unclassified Algoriphagus]UZD23184.1 carbonate dehydratase [Algoriphagus sp. TR-M5]WBL44476.1 carbonate dehydratase [Algoriphagus sp. TR-M9]
MNPYEKLILQNKAWSKEQNETDENFFSRLAKQQKPKFLWIGCSDSRVPANQITGTDPGEIFVHRNIANMVVHTDLNMLSVLQYAVEVLEVEHVIVCGHYGCGGVDAALGNKNLGLINKWLRNIKEVYNNHKDEVDAQDSHEKKVNKLVEINVMEQCQDLIKTSIIQKAWKKRKAPIIHGWAYGLDNGLVNELLNIEPDFNNINPIFRYNEDELA